LPSTFWLIKSGRGVLGPFKVEFAELTLVGEVEEGGGDGAVANPQTAGLIGLSGLDDVYGCHCHSAPQGQFVERDLEPSGLIAGQQNGPVPFLDLQGDVGWRSC